MIEKRSEFYVLSSTLRARTLIQGAERRTRNAERRTMILTRRIIPAALLVVLVLLGGCATPVGVGRLDVQGSYRKLTANVLTHSSLSAPTMQILNRNGLAERFKEAPEDVIARIHKGVPTENEADRLFALAELSFLHASGSEDRSYYLASAVYAYALLFPKGEGCPVDPFDPRFRTAVDIYNLGIAEGLASADGSEVELKGGTHKLPFGAITISVDPASFRWSSYTLVRFYNAARFSIRGLRNEYRWPGIGAALVAATKYSPDASGKALARVPPDIKVAVTALLRLDDPGGTLKTGNVRGKIELYTTDSPKAIMIEGRRVPVEFNESAALAYTLEGSRVYSTETKGFFSGSFSLFKEQSRFPENIFFMTPYKKGHIPVVFIHGTASSAARWVEMLNELYNDQRLWGRYQFWSFTYNTGNPILYTGGMLANGLKELVRALDPDGADAALKQMVIIGHSQGGILAKFPVIDSGTRFWDNGSEVPFDRIDVSAPTRAMLRKSFFYEPLPFVRRVVFISTPHRGSYVAGGWIGKLSGRFIHLPFQVLDAMKEVMTKNPDVIDMSTFQGIPKSTGNMDPNSPFIKTFASIPIDPGVTAHSIISVENIDSPKEKWTDGVVKYTSAHIDYAASELVVHSGHSTQGEPETIEEVRRILLLHIGIQ